MQTAKQSAHELIDQLPDNANWDDIMYEFYVKQKIDQGLQDIQNGDVISHEDLKHELFGKNP